ncbi:MAG: tyrosine-type recombinase/integrase [Polyangiaceae bacterium]|nr:tyrosine-type recombinase/integrase [Polyangiaceae bacterium]
MTTLRQAVEEYVEVRRALGLSSPRTAAELRRFVEFLECEKAQFVTTELAIRWARRSVTAQPATCAERLGVVRGFAAWRSATDPRTQVPPRGLLPWQRRRKPPYVYSDGEIERLVAEAARLPSTAGLRGATFSTLFGLLAASGLRLGEALALVVADVDLGDGVLAVRKAKFGKSRFVPVHDSTRRALARYAELRDRVIPRGSVEAFFVTESGTRIRHGNAEWTFAKVSRAIGLRLPAPRGRTGRGPRLHDMRHRFAAARLIAWYRAGLDVERELPKLATYLGHAHVRHTYWYLEAVPEVLQLATERLVGRTREVTP